MKKESTGSIASKRGTFASKYLSEKQEKQFSLCASAVQCFSVRYNYLTNLIDFARWMGCPLGVTTNDIRHQLINSTYTVSLNWILCCFLPIRTMHKSALWFWVLQFCRLRYHLDFALIIIISFTTTTTIVMITVINSKKTAEKQIIITIPIILSKHTQVKSKWKALYTLGSCKIWEDHCLILLKSPLWSHSCASVSRVLEILSDLFQNTNWLRLGSQ